IDPAIFCEALVVCTCFPPNGSKCHQDITCVLRKALTSGIMPESMDSSLSSAVAVANSQRSVCSTTSPGANFVKGPRVSISRKSPLTNISLLQPKSGYDALG